MVIIGYMKIIGEQIVNIIIWKKLELIQMYGGKYIMKWPVEIMSLR